MANSPVTMFMLFIFLNLLASSCESATGKRKNNYVQDACSVTTYRDLCVHSLAPFSDTAGISPEKWARAGVSVTLSEVRNVTQFLYKLKRSNEMRGGGGRKSRVALSDCIETFENSLDELHKSLRILRKLSATDFETQMADLTTFVSAALTDEDTCLDGFEEEGEGRVAARRRRTRMRLVNMIKSRVLKTSYLTSNALALVNKLATAGVGSLLD